MARMPRILRFWAGALVLLALLPAQAAAAAPSANVAALQVALRALHRYNGAIDGVSGPGTTAALRSFQRSHHLPADGVAGPRTRRALGRRGAPALGSRAMTRGDRGWDVAALQFMLGRRGYPTGSVDGGYGAGTRAAVLRFQSAARLPADGVAGGATVGALNVGPSTRPVSHVPAGASGPTGSTGVSGPVRFLRPLNGPEGDGFGYPGGRRHDGIDFPAPTGTPIGAAGIGVVTFAGWNSGGYGNLVIVQHRLGYETWYAHQSSIAVSVGAHVAGGVRIGYVGSTGHASGPHLHFEVRLNGVPINPEPLFLPQSSLGRLAVPALPQPSPPAGDSCPAGTPPARAAVDVSPQDAQLGC
jgi:peptidoglycan hydrolase-like protein with peptidoglycan-binding domain